MASFNSFRERINDARQRSLSGAFNFLNAAPSAVDQVASRAGADDSLQSFNAASSFANQGLNQIQSFGNALNGQLTQNAARGTSLVGQAAAHEQRMDSEREQTRLAKDAADDAERSSIFGTVAKVATTALSIFCERRLKVDIQPLSAKAAWDAVRDIPLYAFRYRHRPAELAYGPIVDEVQAIDPSLLVPMDKQAEQEGIADGMPIRGIDMLKRSAYESAALQLALQRIEALEQRINQLEGKPDLRIAA